MDVLITRLDPGVPLPAYARPGDAGVDLAAAEDVDLAPGERATVRTGLAIALPEGFAGFVHPRSGLAARHGVTVVNAPGTIDAGYRGEIKVILLNTDAARSVSLRRGDRIAQLVVQRVENVTFREVPVLPDSARGGNGFGSTGGHATGQPVSATAELTELQDWRRCAVFGRRRDRDRDLASQAADVAAEAEETVPYQESGPWDAAEPHPELPRVDLGSLQVPVLEGTDIQLVFAEQHGAWVTVRHQLGELQVQAFAAPKRSGLWDEVRGEIAAEIAGAGGTSTEREGPFGIELVAHVPAEPGQPASGLRAVRFTGVDGPRWFLRGLFAGPAAEDPAAAVPLEAVFRDVVVVRGDHPMPPRDLLELRLPPEAAAALEEQARAQQEAQEQNRFTTAPNPFERGPEMTETR